MQGKGRRNAHKYTRVRTSARTKAQTNNMCTRADPRSNEHKEKRAGKGDIHRTHMKANRLLNTNLHTGSHYHRHYHRIVARIIFSVDISKQHSHIHLLPACAQIANLLGWRKSLVDTTCGKIADTHRQTIIGHS